MRRSTSALTAVVLGIALSATMLKAQQTPPAGASGMTGASAVPGMSASRGARYLLRNGWDYLKYQEYERALNFFREAELRAKELNDAERQALAQGIDNARRGMREAADGSPRRSYARSGTLRRPGSFALGRPAQPQQPASPRTMAAAPAPAPSPAPEPIQLASGTADDPSAPPNVAALPPLPAGLPAMPEPEPEPSAPAVDLPALPSASPAPRAPEPARTITLETEPAAASTAPAAIPDPTAMAPATSTARTPAPAPAIAMGPAPAPVRAPEPAATDPAPPSSLAVLPSAGGNPVDLDSVPLPPLSGETAGGVTPEAALGLPATASPRPATPAPTPAPERPAAPATEVPALPQLPAGAAPEIPAALTSPAPAVEPRPAAPTEAMPEPEPAPASQPPAVAERAAPVPAVDPAAPPSQSEPLPAPAADQPSLPPLPSTGLGVVGRAPAPGASPSPRGAAGEGFLPDRGPVGPSTLSPEDQRAVQRIAQRQEEDLRRNGPPDRAVPGPMSASPTTPTTRLEISRAPSPTEARPIRAIPVPDEFVPLPRRDWSPNRKYWSAAAACHMPLYFQDAPLERYGQSVEEAIGPAGRFASYPVDDPSQSIQRNQLLQPFASIGLFAAQIALLPYNLLMDPPWEAEYDLGYYRPGDRTPPDTIYIPVTGVGPPLRGKNY